jgi:N utilization substance protein A
VPEIASGAVDINAIAREAGHRTKIAVSSHQPGVNAKGACIGPMGSRVRNVMTELHGEKIDIVDFSDDPPQFVGNALSPARVLRVNVVDAQARVAQVIVPDYQLSLAIGKEGQNARLAARLTGWKIDIQPDAPGDPGGAGRRPPAARARAAEEASAEQAGTEQAGTEETGTEETGTGETAARETAVAESPAAPEPRAAEPAGTAPGPADGAAGEPGGGAPGRRAGPETGAEPGTAGTVRGGADAPAR